MKVFWILIAIVCYGNGNNDCTKLKPNVFNSEESAINYAKTSGLDKFELIKAVEISNSTFSVVQKIEILK